MDVTFSVKDVDNELVLGVFYGGSDGVPDDVCLYDCLSGEEEEGLNTIEIALISVAACAAVLAYPVYLLALRTRRARMMNSNSNRNNSKGQKNNKGDALPVAGRPFLMDDFDDPHNNDTYEVSAGSNVDSFIVWRMMMMMRKIQWFRVCLGMSRCRCSLVRIY